METNVFSEEALAQDRTDLIGNSTESLNRSPAAEVGYRKPPAQHRFRPGQSGNPAGRPKKARSVAAVFEQELGTSVKIAGRPMARQEAMLQTGIDKALTGDIFAIGRVVKWVEKYDLLTTPGAERTTGVVTLPRGYGQASKEEQSRMYAQSYADSVKRASASAKGWRSNSGLNMKTLLNGILAQRTVIDVDGVPNSTTKLGALMNILSREAAAGNGRAADLVVNLLKRIERLEQEQHNRGPRGFLLVYEPCATAEEWEAEYGAAALARRAAGIDS